MPTPNTIDATRDASTSKSVLKPDSQPKYNDEQNGWKQYPYAITLGENFKTFKQSMAYKLALDVASYIPNFSPIPGMPSATDMVKLTGNIVQAVRNKNVALEQAAAEKPDSAPAADFVNEFYKPPYDGYYTKRNPFDSSVGGNDAINCYWQFNEDDDLIHPSTSHDGRGDAGKGMGRVYSEMYDCQQKILWITCGVAEYTGPDFFKNEKTSDIKVNADGQPSMMSKIGRLFGTAGGFYASIPFYPFQLSKWLDRTLNATPINKYMNFKPTMPMYYRTVNVLLSHMAVNIGLYPSSGTTKFENNNLPEVLKNGPDVYEMLLKRSRFQDPNRGKTPPLDDVIADLERSINKIPFVSSIKGMFDSFSSTMYGGMDFVGFKLERTAAPSESISNSTRVPEIATKMNENATQDTRKEFGMPQVDTGNTGLIGEAWKSYKGVISKNANAAFGKPVSIEMMTGNGYYDFPEVWNNSSFSRSCSFNLSLRSRYGDPVSVFQSVMVPLSLLLGMALPRQVNKSMYTAPFYLQAYCKGMFAITLGLIESISMRRGANEFGWTRNDLPLVVDVSVNIKDLSPIMFIGSGNMSLTDIFSGNDAAKMYFMVLCGMGLQDMLRIGKNLKRRWQTWLMIKKNTIFSKDYWTYSAGASLPSQIMGAFSTNDKYSKR